MKASKWIIHLPVPRMGMYPSGHNNNSTNLLVLHLEDNLWVTHLLVRFIAICL